MRAFDLAFEVKVDYEFSFDDFSMPQAAFSSGHEAIATYFNLELSTPERCKLLLEKLQKVERQGSIQQHIQGREFQLRLSHEGAEVIANSLGYEVYEELPESCELYDQELQADCGLLDFQQALLDWLSFLTLKP